MINHITFNHIWFVTQGLKGVLGYDLDGFSIVCFVFLWGGGGGGRGGVVVGCFIEPRKDKWYAYLPNLAGNQMGQNYDGLLVEVLNVRR